MCRALPPRRLDQVEPRTDRIVVTVQVRHVSCDVAGDREVAKPITKVTAMIGPGLGNLTRGYLGVEGALDSLQSPLTSASACSRVW
jgi:hypothetical protein